MITPQEVKDYTAFEDVKERDNEQMKFDIIQASQDIFTFAGHKFTDSKYAVLPEEVKLAFMKLTEYYALVNSDESITKGYTTEKIGDYSYTITNGSVVQKFSLHTLLSDHLQLVGENRIRFRLRSL